MTAPKGGEVIEAATRPDLLAPGTVQRPAWIDETTWARMPWPAQWRAARRAVARPSDTEDDGARPCGTYAAYKRHRRRKETPCRACLDANNAEHRARRVRLGLPTKRLGYDPVRVELFILNDAPWDSLSVDERIAAARRLDATGSLSRAEIARRTRLSPANLRRAFYPQGEPVRVDRIPCGAEAMERTG